MISGNHNQAEIGKISTLSSARSSVTANGSTICYIGKWNSVCWIRAKKGVTDDVPSFSSAV